MATNSTEASGKPQAIPQSSDFANRDYREIYAQERTKRLRKEGLKQYIDPAKSNRFGSLIEDPWVETGTPINSPVPNDGHRKILIIGAGFASILHAVKLLKAGFSTDDLLIVDPAGGFGGTWYWNRYPGLMCDVESYIYMPLLEEMDYMPTRKYASGEELRKYAESIAQKLKLYDSAMFQSSVKRVAWDSGENVWKIDIVQKPKGGQEKPLSIRTDFVIFASGIFHSAKLPDVPGITEFEGEMFHTARWAYDITGGSSADPQLTKLKDKRVALIGTGATAIQAVPELAKWSKELIVFQRTPSAVDVRGNHDTDPAVYKTKIATKPGWQRERCENYNAFMSNVDPKPSIDMVNDGWTSMPSYSAIIGGPRTVTMDNVGAHLASLHDLDFKRQERVRQRAVEIVKDSATAKSLQAWYPGWCKRPCFHDEYLQTFNAPHVTLVDTDGKGINRITSKGIVANGKQYDIDLLVWGTGFPSVAVGSMAQKAGIEVIGKDGLQLDTVFANGQATLHGVITRGFPNMFWTGFLQGGATANYTYILEIITDHVAYIVSETSRRAGSKFAIEPTAEAQEQWSQQIMQGALAFAAVSGCTPSYFNKEGEVDLMSQEEQFKAARTGVWGRGVQDFVDTIAAWRTENELKGLEISVA